MQNKKKNLDNILRKYNKMLVAFSGGVDSTFLLNCAHDVLGSNVAAVTARSPLHPERETEFAVQFAKSLKIKHVIVDTDELAIGSFVRNPPDRCYICKMNLFRCFRKISSQLGFDHIAHGANLDDLDDFRPGFRAAKEHGVIAPLIDAGLTKPDIRRLSKEMDLSTWDKPAMACLASRIQYGLPITREKLKMVGQAETLLLRLGLKNCRVRYHETVARIEVLPEDLDRIMAAPVRQQVVERLRKIGFNHVALDMEGYVQGSMNRGLDGGLPSISIPKTL